MSHHGERLADIMPLMQHVISHFSVQATPSGKHLGLTNTRMMALTLASRSKGLAMSELASALNLPAPLATRTADELVERELLERKADESDRRRVLVTATPAGVQAMDDVHRDAERMFAPMIARMTAKEAEALVVGLEALVRVMPGHGGPLAPHPHP